MAPRSLQLLLLLLLFLSTAAQAQTFTCEDTVPAKVKSSHIPVLNLTGCDPLYVYTKKGNEILLDNRQKLQRAEARLADIRTAVQAEREASQAAMNRMEQHIRYQKSALKRDSVRMDSLVLVADKSLDNSRKAVKIARANQAVGILGAILSLIAVAVIIIK